MMSELSYPKTILRSPLSEDTRMERRILLILSAISIAIAKTSILPSKIVVPGAEIERINKWDLLYYLAYVVLYFLLSFFVYSLSDFWLYRVDKYISSFEYYKKVSEGVNSISANQDRVLNETGNLRVSLGNLTRAVNELASFMSERNKLLEKKTKKPSQNEK